MNGTLNRIERNVEPNRERMQMSRIKQMAVVAAAVMTVSACDDASPLIPEGEASFAIVLQPENATAGAVFSMVRLSADDASSATISLDKVESINLPIGDVEALSTGAGSGGWVEAGSVDAVVDLLNLPADGVALAEGSLPEGFYRALRFQLTDVPTIVLNEDITVGRTVYPAGEHELVIPGADGAGMRLTADFEVTDDGQTLTVLVDGPAMVRNIIATGSGALKIAPVLRVQNQDGDDVGDSDDEENEDEGEVEGLITAVEADDSTFTVVHDERTITVEFDSETEVELGEGLESWADVVNAFGAGTAISAEAEGIWVDTDYLLASELELEVVEDDSDDDDG